MKLYVLAALRVSYFLIGLCGGPTFAIADSDNRLTGGNRIRLLQSPKPVLLCETAPIRVDYDICMKIVAAPVPAATSVVSLLPVTGESNVNWP